MDRREDYHVLVSFVQRELGVSQLHCKVDCSPVTTCPTCLAFCCSWRASVRKAMYHDKLAEHCFGWRWGYDATSNGIRINVWLFLFLLSILLASPYTSFKAKREGRISLLIIKQEHSVAPHRSEHVVKSMDGEITPKCSIH